MRVRLSQLLQPSVRKGLREAGLDVVRVGEVPWWMERVVSLPAPLYRVKQLEDQ